ncbi:MAG: dienelactone hydrolase family protein [Deltaproteobacteria bacterium]|nr:dienelactone hydrolase family protein [Deltaproteobacteria bacterium]
MKVVNRELATEKDGIPGYIAHPKRDGRGPGLLIVHHHYGITGHLKSFACNLAELGYTTVVPDLYGLLGCPAPYHAHTGSEVQARTTDAQFVEVIHRGWSYLCGRSDIDPGHAGVIGFCMGGRIAIHFVSAEPSVKAFVGYYPSVRDEQPSELRPRHPCDAARGFKSPSLIYYGGEDRVAPIHIQERLWKSLIENGQRLEWHFLPHAGHGFALADGDCYDPHLASLVWPLTADFLARELENQ